MTDTQQQVRAFYDQIGWQQVSEGVYQNARYEDLRPVSREYTHRCHLRVNRFLTRRGDYLLDAGSGPIQYPEYLTYSEEYRYRVCADISIQAMREARRRLGGRGLYVVADIANLPFKADVFDGIVSLHAIHHLPYESQILAYRQLYRSLKAGRSMAVVNAWKNPPLIKYTFWLVRLAEMTRYYAGRVRYRLSRHPAPQGQEKEEARPTTPTGTYAEHYDARTLLQELGMAGIPVEIRSWRSLSVRFLRALIHPWLGGRLWLWLVYRLEDIFPHSLGRIGQYPLIVIRKP